MVFCLKYMPVKLLKIIGGRKQALLLFGDQPSHLNIDRNTNGNYLCFANTL